MKRAVVILNCDQAAKAGDDRHGQVIMREFAHRNDLRVIAAERNPIANAWGFEVETDGPQLPAFPTFMEARPHK